MEVRFFNTGVEKFIKAQKVHEARIARSISLLESFGHQLRMPDSRSLGNNLFELRIDDVPQIRLFYSFKYNCAFILHGFTKKSQKTPRRELQTALERKSRLESI